MRNKAQTTIEYFVMLGIIVAGLIGMQVYLKRSMQGKFRLAADELSQGIGYSPGATIGFSVVTTNTVESSASERIDKINEELGEPTGDKITITTSDTRFNQDTDRTEQLLSLESEPRRW